MGKQNPFWVIKVSFALFAIYIFLPPTLVQAEEFWDWKISFMERYKGIEKQKNNKNIFNATELFEVETEKTSLFGYSQALSNVEEEKVHALADKIKFTGSLWEYFFWQDNNFFLDASKDQWFEFIGKIGAEVVT